MKKKEDAVKTPGSVEPSASCPTGNEISGKPGDNPLSVGAPDLEVKDAAPDPFNPAALRLSQDFGLDLNVEKKLVTIPVHRPNKQTFFRLHPDPAYRFNTYVLELKEDRETYLVDPSLWQELHTEIVPKALFLGVTSKGVVFLLPISLPKEDRRYNEWSRSAMEIATLAMKDWVRMESNMDLGAYEALTARNPPFAEPAWPALSMEEILLIAFKDHYIDSPNHAVCRSLRGEI